MQLFHVDITETIIERRRVLVSASTEAEARDAAVSGAEITSERLPAASPLARTADAVAAYVGPRYVIEEIEDDPGYYHSIDTKSGDIVELHSSREDAQDHIDSLNGDDEDVDEAA